MKCYFKTIEIILSRQTRLIMAAKTHIRPGLAHNLSQRWSNSLVKRYLLLFCEKSGIHGFFYFAQSNLLALEKYLALLYSIKPKLYSNTSINILR